MPVIYKQTNLRLLTCTMSEQANSTHLTDNLLTLNFPVLQCKTVASSVQQTVVFVLEPVKSKLIVSQWLNCNWL